MVKFSTTHSYVYLCSCKAYRYANQSCRKGLIGEMAIWANKKYHGHWVLPQTIMAELQEVEKGC